MTSDTRSCQTTIFNQDFNVWKGDLNSAIQDWMFRSDQVSLFTFQWKKVKLFYVRQYLVELEDEQDQS